MPRDDYAKLKGYRVQITEFGPRELLLTKPIGKFGYQLWEILIKEEHGSSILVPELRVYKPGGRQEG